MDKEELRKREVEVASADTGCYQKADLASVRFEVQTRIERNVREEKGDVLDSLKSMRAASIDRARRLASAASR